MPPIISFSRSISAAPVELELAHADMVDVGLVDLVQGVAGGDQDFFRRAAAIGAGAAKVAFLSIATFIPASRVGTVTPKPALPPPRISTS
jgi:hypothetical protein